MRTTGQAGIKLITSFEGCRLTAYKCPAGVWTIGYGHTRGVQQGQTITKAQAARLLAEDLERYEDNVNKYYDRYRWSQNEFDALVSFAYNVGSIDKLTAGGTRSRQEIADKMLLYNKANGKALAGLTRRRQAERELFVATSQPTLRRGDRGDAVKILQTWLCDKGYTVVIDGIFGDETYEAVKAYQADHGLTVDGVVGPKTWSALNNK